MKSRVVSFFISLGIAIVLVPHLVFATALFTPRIQNKGSYKKLHPASESRLHPLFGHVPADTNNSTKIAPMDENALLKLSIVLPLNHEDELDQTLIELTNPTSTRYQQFLSQADFIARYAPTQEQVQKVKSHLEAHGLTIESVDSNLLIIHALGSVGSINRIFNTEIYHYMDQHGQEFYAPAYELQVERSLGIHSVQGLENRIKAHPQFRMLPTPGSSESGPSQGLTPANIRKAYSFSSSLNGAGQILALFELDGFLESDITAYENAFNLPHVPLRTILVDGATGVPGEGAGEVVLDIELMIALAPGVSQILVYEGPNTGKGLLDTYNKIATDNLAKSVSTSWGLSETANTGSLLQAENQIFKQMVAQGQALYAASGDNGAYDDGSNLGVDDPASQPLVVAVGGTSLFTQADGSYGRESTWSSGDGPGQSGGGGGISTIWSIPVWQQGAISPSSGASTTMRNVPDVALDADPSTGYAIFFGGQWQVFGGTSCAAPLWAAFNALVDQSRASNGASANGFPSPIFYQLGQSTSYASAFHDISDHSTNGHYPALSGFDLATGWGSFYGDALISLLAGTNTPPPATCSHANPIITIAPSTQQAVAGGTLDYTVTIQNNDSQECASSSFNLAASVPNGFTQSLGQNSVNLAPQASASTKVSLTSAPDTTAGNYQFTVNGVNSTSSSWSGSAFGTYVIEAAQSPNLTLAISPENASFRYNSQAYADFHLSLTNDQAGVANQAMTLTILGPLSLRRQITTGASGAVRYMLLLNRAVPMGLYQMIVSTNYNGNTITKRTNFLVR